MKHKETDCQYRSLREGKNDSWEGCDGFGSDVGTQGGAAVSPQACAGVLMQMRAQLTCTGCWNHHAQCPTQLPREPVHPANHTASWGENDAPSSPATSVRVGVCVLG